MIKKLKEIFGNLKAKMKSKNQILIEKLSGFLYMDLLHVGYFYLYGNVSCLISHGLFFV